MLWELYRDFAGEMQLGKEYDATMEIHAAKLRGDATPVQITQKIAFVESVLASNVCEREIHLNEVTIPMGPMPGLPTQRVVQQEVVRAGWRPYN